jgi:hypothetical protein
MNRTDENVHEFAIHNHEANRLLGKSKHSWNDNVKVKSLPVTHHADTEGE